MAEHADTPKVTVVDYGIGNIFSVTNALRALDVDVVQTGDPSEIERADRLILPGVGAFARAMDALDTLGLSDPLRSYADSGKPFMGVCIGMQVMMEGSEEFGHHDGLGIFPGKVAKIDPELAHRGRVPHISWATLEPGSASGEGGASDWKNTILEGITPGRESVYYVHSFHCQPANEAHSLATSRYGDAQVTAAIRKNNVYGVQFHPERSGLVGLSVLEAFSTL